MAWAGLRPLGQVREPGYLVVDGMVIVASDGNDVPCGNDRERGCSRKSEKDEVRRASRARDENEEMSMK